MFRDLLTGIIIRAMIAKGRLDVKRMHRQASMARKNNDRLFFSILKTNQNSEIGRKYKFDQIKPVRILDTEEKEAFFLSRIID